MRAKLLLLIVLLGTVSAQAVPRFFVEAEAQPIHPADVYSVRIGAITAKRQLYIGFLNVNHEPEVESTATKWLSAQQVLLGIKWFITEGNTALFIPALGGGVSYGVIGEDHWTYADAAFPQEGFKRYGSTGRQYAGVFAEVGTRFRVKRTPLMLGLDLHLNTSFNSRTYENKESRNVAVNVYSFAFFLLGATYQF